IQPSIACGPPSAVISSGIVMNGPTPIMLIMLSAVAWTRPKRRASGESVNGSRLEWSTFEGVRNHPSNGRRLTRGHRGEKLSAQPVSMSDTSQGEHMAPLSRREFLRTAATDAAVAALLAAHVAELRANPLGLPIGSQTWPHRQMIKDGNFAGLARTLADIGVQTVELCSPIGYADFTSLSDGKLVKKILGDHGLACESCHFN